MGAGWPVSRESGGGPHALQDAGALTKAPADVMRHGLRREAERHAAFGRVGRREAHRHRIVVDIQPDE